MVVQQLWCRPALRDILDPGCIFNFSKQKISPQNSCVGIYNHLRTRNIAAVESLDSPDDSLLFYWTCPDWNNICLVGLCALCHWLLFGLAVAKVACQTVRRVFSPSVFLSL